MSLPAVGDEGTVDVRLLEGPLGEREIFSIMGARGDEHVGSTINFEP